MINRTRFLSLLLLTIFLCSANQWLPAQELFLQDQFGDSLPTTENLDEPVTLSGEFKVKTGTRLGVLRLTAEIAENWHVYSLTQPKGGPIRSTIRVDESDQFKIIGPFNPNAPPHVTKEVEGFDVPVEDHADSVTWSAPIQLADGVDPEGLTINIVYDGQTCYSSDDGQLGACKLIRNQDVVAKFAGNDGNLKVSAPKEEKKAKKFRPKSSHVTFFGRVVRADGANQVIQPGDKVTFELTAEPEGEFHVYAFEHQKTGAALSTLVVFVGENIWKVMKPRLSEEPELNLDPEYEYHEKPITWSFDMLIPDDAEKKNYELSGLLGFQTCTKTACDRPDGAKFSFVIPVGSAPGPIPVEFSAGSKYADAEKAIKSLPPESVPTNKSENQTIQIQQDSREKIAEMATYYDEDEKVSYLTLSELDANPIGTKPNALKKRPETTIWTALFGAFVGGMLLNLMPCVFPVLGLKVMGFVEQAGSEPRKIRMHGLAFTLGLVVSMWILAGIILIMKYSLGQDVNWGAQMGNPYFVVAMIILLFVLGLNMAGVFEIGTSLTRVGGNVQSKGYTGSFLSGILTTLIATPCSGPFLGAAMGYTLAQPPATSLFLFTIFALGIASPYLVLSFFPALINKLPRPGAWMETFKVTMAFALFATVAFFMQAFGGQTGVDGLSWLAMALVVIGLAAYFYGKWSLPHIKVFKRRAFGYGLPLLIAGLGIWMAYDAANQRHSGTAVAHKVGGLNWQTWNPGKIEYIIDKSKKIVWVDYTADW